MTIIIILPHSLPDVYSTASYYDYHREDTPVQLVCYGRLDRLPENTIGTLGQPRPVASIAIRAAKYGQALIVCGLSRDPKASIGLDALL